MATCTRPARSLHFAGLAVFSLVVPLLLPAPAHASSQLALDRGCYTCHGNPPRKNAPTFAQLASRYAKHRGNTSAENALVEKLRQGSFLGHIDAHERLSQDDARRLVHWIIEGAH